MNRFRADVGANFAGQLSVSAIQLLMIPQYVRFLGVEAYGLVGFFLTLQAIFQLLDLGLSPTVNRALARYSVLPGTAGEARDFVRTFEMAYWLAGGLLGGAVFAAAPFVATGWLGQSALSRSTTVDAIRMMGVLAAAQWPLTFYHGALLGLGRPGVLSAVRVSMTAASAAGAFVVLARISTTIGAFFRWQAAASLVYVAVMALALWRCLPRAAKPSRVRFDLLAGVWQFAAGMTVITGSGMLLSQLDRLILSRVLPLEQFG